MADGTATAPMTSPDVGMRFADAAPRRRLTPEAAERHSKIVRSLRLAVPAAAAGLLGTYVFTAAPPSVDTEFLRQFSEAEAPGREVVLERPRYVGQTVEGTPYEVSAQAARRNPDTPGLVRFDNPEALRDGTDGPGVRVQAKGGLLDTEANTFALDRDVRITQGLGGQEFVLETDAADVDLDARVVSSTVGVRGTSETGSVEAGSLTVYEDEQRATFSGGVKLRFEPAAAKKDKPTLRN